MVDLWVVQWEMMMAHWKWDYTSEDQRMVEMWASKWAHQRNTETPPMGIQDTEPNVSLTALNYHLTLPLSDNLSKNLSHFRAP